MQTPSRQPAAGPEAAAPAPRFFATPAELRAWFAKHHASAAELLVGFWKTSSGVPSITWPESVDEALCFGWIDGLRKSGGERSYTIRFTPRRATSIWSAVNLKRVAELRAQGRMQPAGLKAFEGRDPDKAGIYSHEQRREGFEAAHEAAFRKHAPAWAWFEARSASYRRAVYSWVGNAKQAATREKRLASAIEHSARETTLPQFTVIKPPSKKAA